MSLSIGIVGLPNVGKSTLFKALTKKQVDISNYPFCTIDKNVGVVAVPDQRLNDLRVTLNPTKILPATIEFIDIAGLVKNAHKGEGLGNQFLSHIREVDAILHLVRFFADKDIAHVSGKIDSQADIEVVNLELIFADLDLINKRIADIKPKAKSGGKEAQELLDPLEKIKDTLDKGKPASAIDLNENEKDLIKALNLLTIKPMLFVYNVAEKSQDESKLPSNGISISAKLEAELADLSDKEIGELGYEKTGLDKLIKASFKLLDLITFFTTQNNILQAWTVPRDTKAPQAAGVIHTDFEEKFIKADVISWENLKKAGSEAQAREKGLLRTEGKDYVVQEGDVINFKI